MGSLLAPMVIRQLTNHQHVIMHKMSLRGEIRQTACAVLNGLVFYLGQVHPQIRQAMSVMRR